jgi:hypothetical protein
MSGRRCVPDGSMFHLVQVPNEALARSDPRRGAALKLRQGHDGCADINAARAAHCIDPIRTGRS